MGLPLDPWQERDLDVILAERADGRWAAREAALVVARQNGKGNELTAIELADLFLFDTNLVLHSAHEFKTAIEAFRRLKFVINGSDDLTRRVKRIHESHGSEGIELTNGQRVQFVARSRGSGRGFSGDRIILDEAYDLTDASIEALGPTMRAMDNPQVLYTSSAPLDEVRSDVLRRVCRRGRAGGSETLAYIEYSAHVDPDDPDAIAAALDDPEQHAYANPSYPHRITDEAIQADREMLSPEGFARECLTIFSTADDDAGWVIPKAAWDATEDDGSDIEGPQTWALEVSPDRDWAALAAGGRSSLFPDRKHGTVTDYEPGTSWVVARAKQRTDQFGGVVAVVKGSPAWTLLPALKKAKVPTREVSTAEHAAACGQLYDACLSDPLGFVHRAQGELTTALRLAVKKDNGDGGWVWSRKRSGGDISPLVAVTVAVALVPEQPRARFVDLAAY